LASFSLAGCSDDAPAAARAEQCKGPSDAGDAGFVPATPAEIECGLGRGVNLGNIFEAPEPGDWSVEYDADWLPLLKSAGFSHIRLPVRWTNHAALSADATLDETFATRIDEVIDAALANGLYVVVDAHHYRQLDGEPLDPGEAEVASIDVQERLVNIWRQLSARYHERSNRLVYELYNEPHGQQMAPGWNALAARLLAAVRENDPERVVIVGASEWNDPTSLHELKLPDDSNLIVTFHYYEPYHFVFQGTFVKNSPAWVGITCCDELQRIQIQSGIEIAALFSKQHGVPMYLGEFGSSIVADKASRVDYSRFVRDQAEAHGMPWAVWSMVDMGIYDPDTKAFRPEVLEALVGP
jgi:endoglucanase